MPHQGTDRAEWEVMQPGLMEFRSEEQLSHRGKKKSLVTTIIKWKAGRKCHCDGDCSLGGYGLSAVMTLICYFLFY